ncbi:MAG: dTMP kinase [Pseudomonadota bacterium]
MTRRFITFEGIDGAGKSTHLPVLAGRLRATGATVLLTREPGGTPLAEELRGLLLGTAMDPLTEALLVFAGRRDHVQQVIAPALQRGHTVLCDRFSDASAAYQGGGRGVPIEVLERLEEWVHPGLQPDLTFWFDLPAEMAAQRLAGARVPDRFEQQDTAFFSRVRQAYARRADEAPQRYVRLDAAAPVADVGRQIEQALEARGW